MHKDLLQVFLMFQKPHECYTFFILTILEKIMNKGTEDMPKGFISDILKDEAEYVKKTKASKKVHEQVVESEIKENPADLTLGELLGDTLDIANPEENANASSSPTTQGEDEISMILDTPPHYYIIKNIPEGLLPKFDNVDKVYFGVKLLQTNNMKPNMVSQPVKVHKLFLALLIKPPIYEDILKSHKASVTDSSFAFNLEEECYYRWFNNLPTSSNYYEFCTLCDRFGISMHMHYNPQKLLMALENVKEL